MTDRPPEHLLAFPEIMIESHPAAFFDSLIFGLRFFISCHNTFYHHTTVVLKPQGPAKKLIIDLRPTYHPMADSEIFRKTHPAPDLRSAILHVGTLFFWLNAVHPYEVRPFKSRRPEEKFTIDLRTTEPPTTNFYFSLR